MLKVLSYILCDLDPKVKVTGQKAGICDGVPSTSALVFDLILYVPVNNFSAMSGRVFLGSLHTLMWKTIMIIPVGIHLPKLLKLQNTFY